MNEDSNLLRQYALEGSEDAFTELVQRNIDLVFSVALRVTQGQTALAEEIAQHVFADLAKKARLLPLGTVPAAWLHHATRLEALAVIRSEGRRRAREHIASLHSENEPSMDSPNWDELAPVLDEALDELVPNDRQAIILRYFRNQPFSEVGNSLGVAEDAARMRVSRALDRLAAGLARRGVKSTAAAISLLIGEQGVVSAPAGLALNVASTTLAQISIAGRSTLILMKTKLFIGSIVMAVLLGPVWWMHRNNLRLSFELDQLKAERDQAALKNIPIPIPGSSSNPDEHRELLRLRGEVGALRRSLMAALAATNQPAIASESERQPGEHFIQTVSSRVMTIEGKDQGPVADRHLQGTHLGRFLRLDMLRDAGDSAWTNAVETALWAAHTGRFSEFERIFNLDSAATSAEDKERFLRQRMDVLAVNLGKSSGLEFRNMVFDDENNQWNVTVLLDSGSVGSRLGTHFNFRVREEQGHWQVVGYAAGNAIIPRVP